MDVLMHVFACLRFDRWLLNSTRFCISEDWPSGVTDDCYWGLPSISADDPAFPPLGYWRGYVWGPMIQLTQVQHGGDGSPFLIPIDHGFCLPETLTTPCFEWRDWPQVAPRCSH